MTRTYRRGGPTAIVGVWPPHDRPLRATGLAWANLADPKARDTRRTVAIAFNAMKALGINETSHPGLFGGE